MSLQVDFQTPEEAAEAFYGGDPDDADQGSPLDDEERWGQLEQVNVDWEGGWTLQRQRREDTDERRYFITRWYSESDGEYLDASANVGSLTADTPLGDIPNHPSQTDAEDAYEDWLDTAEEGEREGDEYEDEDPRDDGEDGHWTEWEQVDNIEGWYIFESTHTVEDRSQYIAAGANEQGDTIFLAPGGEVQEEPHEFDTMDEVAAAVDAFNEALESGEGDHDEETQVPTGDSPASGTLPDAPTDSRPSGPLGGAIEAVGGRGNALRIALVVLVLLAISEWRGYTDITGFLGDLI